MTRFVSVSLAQTTLCALEFLARARLFLHHIPFFVSALGLSSLVVFVYIPFVYGFKPLSTSS